MAKTELRKYGAAATFTFSLHQVDGIDFQSAAPPAAGDIQIMKNEGVEAATTNLFVDEGTGYSITLTAAEMQAARIVLYVVDQTATKVWLDIDIKIETYGDVLAQHELDLGAAIVDANVTTISGAAQTSADLGFEIGLARGDINTLLINASDILLRIGSFAGTGVNSILGFFRASLRNSATLPSDIGGSYDPLTHSLQAQSNAGIAHDAQLAITDAKVNGIQSDTAEIGIGGIGLTNINLQNQTMDITGNVTGTISSVLDGAKASELAALATTIGTPISTDIATDIDNVSNQVSGIGAASGGAFSFEITEDNTLTPIKGVTFVGVETAGAFASIEAEDGAYHQITHVGNVIDIVYGASLGTLKTAVDVTVKGFLNSNNDTLNIHLYDFAGAQWQIRHILTGQAGNTNVSFPITVLQKHTGTGVEAGKVYIRFEGTGTSPVLFSDEVLVSAVTEGSVVGYANGAVWFDSVLGTIGTVPDINGVADLKSLSWSEAQTIASLVKLNKFEISNGSLVTLNASIASKTLLGEEWDLDLAGQDISETSIHGATVNGVGIGAGSPELEHCNIQVVTTNGGEFRECGFSGTYTMGAAGVYSFDRSHSNVAGTASPIYAFGQTVGNIGANFRNCSGGVDVRSMGTIGVDTMSLEGRGQLIIGADCNPVNCTIVVRGAYKITDNVPGGFVAGGGTLDTTENYDVLAIAAQVDIVLTAAHGSGSYLTGSGGSITDIINVIPIVPTSFDLSFATYRMGFMITNQLDNLPTGLEITPGTISVARKPINTTSWLIIESLIPCLETDGVIFYDTNFPSGTYVEGDSIRLQFRGQKVTVSGNDYEITNVADGMIFYTEIRYSASVGGLTPQQTRDAMKLDASVGAPATGSLDEKLDNVETSTGGLAGVAMRGTDGANTVVPTSDVAQTAQFAITDGKVDGVGSDVTLVKSQTDKIPENIKKNVALNNFTFFMKLSSDHVTGATGLTVVAKIRRDNGAFVLATNSVTEVSQGFYSINYVAADLNADSATLLFTAPNADATMITIPKLIA